MNSKKENLQESVEVQVEINTEKNETLSTVSNSEIHDVKSKEKSEPSESDQEKLSSLREELAKQNQSDNISITVKSNAYEYQALERDPSIKVSVVINAFNEEKVIGNMLASLEQIYFPGMQVIISDDGSTDRTAEIVREFQQKIGGEWLILDSHPNLGFSGAKNSGASKASGEYLFFFDADAAIPKDLIQHDLKQMEEHDIDLASHYLMPESGGFKNNLTMRVVNLGMQTAIKPVIAGCGGILVKKELFDKIGGFGHVPVSEDIEFVRRANQNGAKIAMIKGMKMPVNMRRFNKNGHIKTLIQWGKASVYNLLGRTFKEGELEYSPVRDN